MTTNTLAVASTFQGSTIITITLQYSTLLGSTISANTLAVASTFQGSTISTNILAVASSIQASTILYSTIVGSTIFASSTIINSELINSSLVASTISTQNLSITSNPWNITTPIANISDNITATTILKSLLININGQPYKILLYQP